MGGIKEPIRRVKLSEKIARKERKKGKRKPKEREKTKNPKEDTTQKEIERIGVLESQQRRSQ